jgi:hypothetical protein
MSEQGPCEICDNQAEYVLSDFFPGRRCPRCGEFDYDTSVGWRKITSPDEMVRLSGWVREQNAAGWNGFKCRYGITRLRPGLRDTPSPRAILSAPDDFRRRDGVRAVEVTIRQPPK